MRQLSQGYITSKTVAGDNTGTGVNDTDKFPA
jgi:hypothetical protein